MDVGVILGAAGIAAAFAVPIGIETFERPRLEINASSWVPAGPVRWTFATVRVRNRPAWQGVRKLITRQAAQACAVELDYYRWDTEEKVLPTIPGRWSSHQQPIRYAPYSHFTSHPPTSTLAGGPYPPNTPVQPYSGGTASTFGTGPSGMSVPFVVGAAPSGAPAAPPSPQFDASLDSPRQDVAVGPEGGEVAVAILTESEAFAFSTESYAHYAFGNPAWKLQFGSYRVVVRVHGSGVNCARNYRLDYNSDGFTDFRLKPA